MDELEGMRMPIDDVLLHVDPPVVVLHVLERAGDWTLDEIKESALINPGDYRLALCVGRHTLAFGESFNVEPTQWLVTALGDFGRVEVIDAACAQAEGNGAPSPRGVHLPRSRRSA
jgi:hypothetical protein